MRARLGRHTAAIGRCRSWQYRKDLLSHVRVCTDARWPHRCFPPLRSGPRDNLSSVNGILMHVSTRHCHAACGIATIAARRCHRTYLRKIQRETLVKQTISSASDSRIGWGLCLSLPLSLSLSLSATLPRPLSLPLSRPPPISLSLSFPPPSPYLSLYPRVRLKFYLFTREFGAQVLILRLARSDHEPLRGE